MSEEFVRKDYHDETIRRIETLMERNMAKQEAMNAKQEALITDIRGEIKNIHTRIDGVVDTFSVAINDLKERIDDIKSGQSNGFARWGIIVAIVVGVVQETVPPQFSSLFHHLALIIFPCNAPQ